MPWHRAGQEDQTHTASFASAVGQWANPPPLLPPTHPSPWSPARHHSGHARPQSRPETWTHPGLTSLCCGKSILSASQLKRVNIFVPIPQHATLFPPKGGTAKDISLSGSPPPAVPGENGPEASPARAPNNAGGSVVSLRVSHTESAPRGGAAPQDSCPSRGGLCREVRPAPAGQPQACLRLTAPPAAEVSIRPAEGRREAAAGARVRPKRGRPRRRLPLWGKPRAAHLVYLIRHLSNRLPRSPARVYGPSPSPLTGAGPAVAAGPHGGVHGGERHGQEAQSIAPAGGCQQEALRRAGGAGGRAGGGWWVREGGHGRPGRALRHRWGLRPLQASGGSVRGGGGPGAAGCRFALSAALHRGGPVRERAVTSGWRRGSVSSTVPAGGAMHTETEGLNGCMKCPAGPTRCLEAPTKAGNQARSRPVRLCLAWAVAGLGTPPAAAGTCGSLCREVPWKKVSRAASQNINSSWVASTVLVFQLTPLVGL